MKGELKTAMQTLGDIFAARDWRYLDVDENDEWARAWAWPGPPNEDIMVCVHKGSSIFETFHRQDFFFLNFAYKGSYDAISYRFDNFITVNENECYVGQPYTGYALNKDGDEEFIIIGVLMKRELFYRELLPILSTDSALFRFFLSPRADQFSDEFIHVKFDKNTPMRPLLEMMVVEYAAQKEDTQAVLRGLVVTLLQYIARQYRDSRREDESARLSDRILRYIGEHPDTARLNDIARRFSYHPNYISTLLRRELGRTFSEILLEQRMERAAMLLRGTDCAVEEVASMVGYSNTSNFYKAFRTYYGVPPREYANPVG